VVAQLRHEEALQVGRSGQRETLHGAVGRFHVRLLAFFDLVALYPGAEIALGHVVLLRAGAHAVSAADALVDIDDHPPPVVGRLVGVGRRLRAQDLLQGRAGRGQNQKLAADGEEIAPRHFHFVRSSEMRIVRLMARVA
jgi:hypothetical protein